MKKSSQIFNSIAASYMRKQRILLNMTLKDVASRLELSVSTYSDRESGVGINTFILIQFSIKILNMPIEIMINEIYLEWKELTTKNSESDTSNS